MVATALLLFTSSSDLGRPPALFSPVSSLGVLPRRAGTPPLTPEIVLERDTAIHSAPPPFISLQWRTLSARQPSLSAQRRAVARLMVEILPPSGPEESSADSHAIVGRHRHIQRIIHWINKTIMI